MNQYTTVVAPTIAPLEPLSYSVEEVAKVTGLSRCAVFDAMNSGALPRRKVGRRTLVLADDVRKWLAGLPSGKNMDRVKVWRDARVARSAAT